ncbi:MAG: YncE family protein [Acidobacteriota bacterium]|nr:YncE family protein [Acidobacteriota bacterium]
MRFLLVITSPLWLFAQEPVPDFKPGSKPITTIRKVAERDGIVVEFTMHQADPAKVSQPFQQGDDVLFTFNITDKATGSPLSNAYPAGWLARRNPEDIKDPDICYKKVETFVSGSLFSRSELDLNVYYVVTLNQDSTLSVVDPLFGFGSSKLLALVELESPGYDWAMDANSERLWVSMPDAGKIAAVETRTWKVIASVAVGKAPGRTALQPDGHYLWVTDRNSGQVTALVAETLETAARLDTGAGPHDLAFNDDNSRVFITNQGADTTSVIDIRKLEKLADLPTGKQPVSVAWSQKAGAVYVSHAGDGAVVSIDGAEPVIRNRLALEPGLGQISFAPGHRHGFIVNPDKNTIHILDIVSNRIVQTGDMESRPDQISYTDNLAYVRQQGSETVWMVPLEGLGKEGAPLSVIDFPGGQHPPGKTNFPTPAAGIVQAPGASAVLVANPLDQSIYFYMEGMAAPMGNFSNYGKQPRALKVIDRSLREKRPGAYQTVGTLREWGPHDMVFFMDSPRTVFCFAVNIEENPVEKAKRLAQVQITPGRLSETPVPGRPLTLSFQLKRLGQTLDGLEDVTILYSLTPGIWHQRKSATSRGNGVYTAEFTPPEPGIYYAYLACPSLGIGFNNPHYASMRVMPAETPAKSGE